MMNRGSKGGAVDRVEKTVVGAVAGGAAGALLFAGLVAVGPPAAAAPVADCAVPYPVDELTRGAAVHGLTVSAGTTPEGFTGEVLGVLDDGIGSGLDMIVARLDSPAIEAAGGIWQGMSGSPVYAQDGRLIGAVSYGLAAGSSPVAGITPYEDMQGYLGPAKKATAVAVGPTMATRIAAETDVSRTEAAQGLRQLPMPLGVAGVDLARAKRAVAKSHGSGPLTAGSYRIGRATGSSAAGIDTVVAGGNVAAVMSSGDVTFAGVGSVTSVCGDRVVAFGHPMRFTGTTRLGLAAADAIYVQEDPLGVPFKVANVGALGGTITDDRLAGIAGTLGASPASTAVTSTVAYDGRSRTGTTKVIDRTALGDVTLLTGLGNHDRVVDGIQGGSETQSWKITGTRGDGTPFTLRYSDRYRSPDDIGDYGSYDLATVMWTLSALPRLKIAAVTNTVQVSDSLGRYRVTKISQRTGGRWVDVTGRTAKVRAGKNLVLRTVLTRSDGTTRTLSQELTVPKRLAGKGGTVKVVGGNASQDEFFGPTTFDGIAKIMRNNQRNDEVRTTVHIGSGTSALHRVRTSSPLPWVVDGQKSVRIRVVR